jgi:hypothetical protein
MDITKRTEPALRVTAKTNGFRRAGRAWSDKPTVVPVADFTEEQVAALKEEPRLVVEELMPEPEAAPEPNPVPEPEPEAKAAKGRRK